jgi:protoporphyrinogen oxidase
MTKNIAIVGSGFLGMTLALRLAEAGHKVTLFEAADHIGGLASAWEISDVVWDKHYHVTLASDSYTRKIVEEIGLGDEFRWVETRTGFYTGGELVSMSNTLEFLKFPPLGLLNKLRLGATIFIASRTKDWQALEKVSVEDWLVKLSGRRTFEKIWKPLLMAKLGLAYRETSAAFIWATIQRMYAARNSGLKKELFGYVRGGYARVLERFGEVLASKGVDIRLNARVNEIEQLPDGKFRIHLPKTRRRTDLRQKTKYGMLRTAAVVAPGFSGGFISEPEPEVVPFPGTENIFDRVILTCPSNIAARAVPQLTAAEKRALEAIRYQGIVCASVLTKCSLSEFYVTNITDDSPFTGIIEMSAMVDKKEFGRNALIYLPKYVEPDDELFDKSDEEIEEMYLFALEKMYRNFKRQDVQAFKVSRVQQVFPLPVIGYSQALPSKRTSLDGLYIVNSSHIVNGTLNVNETVQLAERFYTELQKDL